MSDTTTPTDDNNPSPTLAVMSWWGGWFLGPVVGAVAYVTSSNDRLTRSHGLAAAVVWAALLAFWVPFTAWVIILGGTDPDLLLVAGPVVAITALGSSILGTIQARRGRSLFGRQLVGPTVMVDAVGREG